MNWHIIGNEWASKLLSEHVGRGRVRHAYLFTGPTSVGRRSLALRFAQALNCSQPVTPGEPCLNCRACQQIQRMQHPDLSVVQAETVGGVLKVDQIRELQRSLALAPYEARYRVALLLRFEEAHPSAMNALLKTLEEPPAQVVLMLTAENVDILLPTIVSRCEVLRLRPAPVEQVGRWLHEHHGLSPEQAQLLAHISNGRPGYAWRLAQQADALQQRQNLLDDQARLLAGNRVERFRYAEGISKDKEHFRQALMIWLSFWRDVLLCCAGSSASISNLDRQVEIQVWAERLELQQTRQVIAVMERVLGLLDRNINARLAAEVVMLDLPFS
jgi:DNA polymerase-3 subunit delta'